MSRIDTVGSHKTNVFTQNNVTSVVYHNTAVVQFSPTKIVLDSGGYKTKTTKLRMNQTSNQYGLGFEVYQQNYEWFVKYRGKTLEFYDGMELER